MATRSYTATRRRAGTETIDRVLAAAERLIAEGEFHTATMAELASAAGISRATVFNRFGSKLGVLQALADRCGEGPEMQAIQEALALEDPVASLDALIEASCVIWETSGFIYEQLKAIVVLEPDAVPLIDEQWEDQRADIQGLTRRLAETGRLRPGLSKPRATAMLHTLTSLETFLQLRREYDLSLRQTRETICQLARTLFRA
ncbi:MAG: TetR/AcrR family transcriptional regulator [Actinomycetia bacterium]|nr:TetR/AcrR family transcriptional regulator [Actinomycetes bacterium]